MKNILKLFSILLTFAMTGTSTFAFTDVPSSAWYAEHVNELRELKIIDDATLFNPNDPLKRAELVKMVILSLDDSGTFEMPAYPTFIDVSLNAWFSPYVEEATSRSIVNGYEDSGRNLTGYFGPADMVTRGAAAKVLVRGFEIRNMGSTPVPNFSDVNANDWFYNDLKIAASHGIIEGYGDNTFQGNKEVTRAEMAKMLILSMKVAGTILDDQDTPTTPQAPTTPGTPTSPTTPGTPNAPVAQPNAAEIDDGVISAGTTGKFVARYNFKGNNEGFYVDTVTIANDTEGDSIGDDIEPTLAVKNIQIKYPDKNGLLKTATAPLKSDGTARFTNLDFYVKQDVDSFFEVYADLNDFNDIGSKLSGETFRIGLQDFNADIEVFKAVGEFSDNVITIGNGALITSISDIPTYTMRKSSPSFAIQTPSATLLNGTNNLIGLKVTAKSSGSIALARLTFHLDISDNDNANLTLSNFKVSSGSDVLDEVNIYDATGAQDLTIGSLTHGTSTVIVTFDEQEMISAGQTKTYYLKADVTGAANDDSINTMLMTGDEDAPLTGLTNWDQENTGKIFVNGDATSGIFTGASDFSQTATANKHIIWSDLAFSPHQYPTITDGVVTTQTGSADWTNGYELGTLNLSQSVLSK